MGEGGLRIEVSSFCHLSGWLIRRNHVPFHSHVAGQRPADHRRNQPLGALDRPSASSSAPAPAMRRREFPACRISSSTWSSRARRAARALDVNRDFDRIGAHYNAFTSEENTVFYAAILPEYLPQAVDILADILRPSLRRGRFRHGEEGHHRRDRHVRRSADVVGLRPCQAHLLRRPSAGQQHPGDGAEHTAL